MRAEREGRTHLLQLRRIHDRPPRGPARFYMPRNMELRLAGSISELEREARRLRRTCPDVFILSGDERLPEHTALPVEKVAWNPYPKWIIRYFNFNDWVSLSIRRKNLYKVGASAGEK